jgi:hypothetical protein
VSADADAWGRSDQRRGLSSAMSAANAVADHFRSRGSWAPPRGRNRTQACCSDGSYGIAKGPHLLVPGKALPFHTMLSFFIGG